MPASHSTEASIASKIVSIRFFSKAETNTIGAYSKNLNSLKSAYYDIQEIARDISSLRDDIFFDEEERQEIETRLDLISYDYYGSADYAWLILQANPQYGSMEFSIPDGVELRIPYPLNVSLDAYQKSIETYNKLYN